MTTEDVHVRSRTKREAAFGAEEASMLMDRPPGGWNDLATTQVFEAKLDAVRHELVATMERGFTTQSWRLTTALIASITLMSVILRVL
jgi:hypothetical protein